MTWRCEKCGEEHADQFDACWQCAENAGDNSSPFDFNAENRRLRFSIRSMILLTFSVAAICGIIVNIPHDSMFIVLAMYVSAWLVPAASFGFDYNQSIEGIKNGLIRGAVLCVLSMFVINLFLPTVQ